MINNLSNLSELGNYTLNIIETTDSLTNNLQNKKNDNNHQEKKIVTDLNQAFTKDSQSESLIESCNIKYKSFSLMEESSLMTNQKLSTQLTEFPHFEASSICNNSLTSSTQLPHNGRETRTTRKKSNELSPLKEATHAIQTRSKSTIKVTHLNAAKKSTDANGFSEDLEKNQKEKLAKEIEATLISSDDNDEENSNEISDDESDESLNSKKFKNSNKEQDRNLIEIPDVSPVQKIDATDHSCSIISNTLYEKSGNAINDLLTSNQLLKEDELIVIDKDSDQVVNEKNNRGKCLFLHLIFVSLLCLLIGLPSCIVSLYRTFKRNKVSS